MVQFILKHMLKQRILAVNRDLHRLLVATKLLTNYIHVMLDQKCWKGRSRKILEGRGWPFYLQVCKPSFNYCEPCPWLFIRKFFKSSLQQGCGVGVEESEGFST